MSGFYSFINQLRLAGPFGGDLYLMNFPGGSLTTSLSTISFLKQYILSIESHTIDISTSVIGLYSKYKVSIGSRLIDISATTISLQKNCKLSLNSVSIVIDTNDIYWGQAWYAINIDTVNINIVSGTLWSIFSSYFMCIDAAISSRFTKSYQMATIIKKGKPERQKEPRSEFSSNYIIPQEVLPDERLG